MSKFGKKGFKKVITYVSSHDSQPSDYLNLPVIKDGKAIGVVSEAVFENWVGIKLTLTIWVDLEFMDGKPSAIVFG